MSREEAIAILKVDGCGYCTWQSLNPCVCENKECELKEALEMAIQALSQEPCDDAISREWLMRKATERFYTTNYFNHISAMIEEAPSVMQKSGKWIPVRERLPEEGQEILFSTKTGRVHSGKYHDDDSANQWYSHKDKCRAWNNVVSAWMPLPEPYKAESEDKE